MTHKYDSKNIPNLEDMQLRIIENFRAIFYAPFYVLRALGHAEHENLSIEWIDANVPGGAIKLLQQGEVPVTWGGPMRVMKDHDTNPWSDQSLVGFCEVVGKDPFYLVARSELLPLDLSHLSTLKLAIVTEVPTPWLCLQADFRDAGVNIGLQAQAHIDKSKTLDEQLTALYACDIDVMQSFEPYVSFALEEGGYGIAYRASSRGPTTYTTFITTRGAMKRYAAEFSALERAMARTQNWMAENPESIADVCEPYFPDIRASILRSAIARYVEDKIWSPRPNVCKSGFQRLADSLEFGGFITKAGSYSRCIKRPDCDR